jgi:hypothetical protein
MFLPEDYWFVKCILLTVQKVSYAIKTFFNEKNKICYKQNINTDTYQ